jgi:hypothetical protein
MTAPRFANRELLTSTKLNLLSDSVDAVVAGLGTAPTGLFYISGAAADGVTDDRTVIQATLTTCAAAGGGTVLLGPHRYFIGSDLTVPTNVTLAGFYWSGGERSGTNYAATPYTLVLASTARILTGWNAGVHNLVVQRQGLTRPTTVRETLDCVRAFAGTAIKVNGSEALIENVLILGFNLAIDNSGFERASARNVSADCTNGVLIDGNHDISRFHRVHLWPFVTTHNGSNQTNYAVSGAVDNGSGLIRLTLATHPFTTGDKLSISGVGGVSAAAGRWTVTVIDSVTIDLQASTFAGTYTSGGTVYSAVNVRDGYGFKITNSEAMSLVDCFDYGHQTNFWFSDGAGWTQAIGCGADAFLTAAAPGGISIRIDGTAYGTSWVGGWTSSQQYSVYIDNNHTSAHKFSGATLNSASTLGGPINIINGRVNFSGCSIPHSGTVTVGSGADSVIFSGCDFPNLTLSNGAGAGVVQSDFSTRFSSGGAIQSISLGAVSMASSSALVIAGTYVSDTNQGAQVKITNTTASASIYQRVSAAGNSEWLGTGYTILSRLSQAGLLTAQDLGVLGTKSVSFVLAGPTSGAAAAPTWRQLLAADVSGAAATASPAFTGAVTIGSAAANGGSNTPLWVRGNPTADTARGGEIRMTNPNAGSPDWWHRVSSSGNYNMLNNSYSTAIQITQAGALNLLLGGFSTVGAISIRPGTSVTPASNGDLVFEATSDTQVKVKLKGSDGTVRSVTLTVS